MVKQGGGSLERFKVNWNRSQVATAARRSSGAPAQARTLGSAAVSEKNLERFQATWTWSRRNNLQEFRESGSDVPVGTAASARSIQALRGFIEASAIHTLIRQRPPTPSCGGPRPYGGENSEPDRHTTESLTPIPQVRERPGPIVDIDDDGPTSLFRISGSNGTGHKAHTSFRITGHLKNAACTRDPTITDGKIAIGKCHSAPDPVEIAGRFDPVAEAGSAEKLYRETRSDERDGWVLAPFPGLAE